MPTLKENIDKLTNLFNKQSKAYKLVKNLLDESFITRDSAKHLEIGNIRSTVSYINKRIALANIEFKIIPTPKGKNYAGEAENCKYIIVTYAGEL